MAIITAYQSLDMKDPHQNLYSSANFGTDVPEDKKASTPAAGNIYYTDDNSNTLVIFGTAVAGMVSNPSLVAGSLGLTLIDALGKKVYSRQDTVDAPGTIDDLLNHINFNNGFTPENLAGNDAITGSSFGDILYGYGGNDTLNGGKGADQMIGGQGDDTYIVDNKDDQIAEDSGVGSGSDTVKTSINDYPLGNNIENLTLTGSARIGTGNAEANIITGNAGSNTLYGLVGDDTLDGGKGADTLYGGEGSDVYVVDNVGDKVVEDDANPLTGEFDKVLSSISYSLIDTDGKGDNGNNVENLTLTGHGNINGTGNDKDNEITGNTGNNVLNGGAGKDILDGTEGSDIYLINALSDYTPSVGITDEITDTGLTGADEIRFAATTIGTLTLSANTTGIESVVIGTGTKANAVTTGTIALNVDASAVQNALTITGNTGTNKLTGTDFNDTLDGGKGIDMLTGGAGDDTYTVDNIFDHIAESGGRTGGEDTVITSLNNYELTIIDLENLTLTGSARIGTGNAEANIITGNAGSNTLYGLAGNDTLDGGKGADTLYGGEGSDVYVVDNVGDKVVEDDADPLTGGFDKVLSSISYSLIDTDGKGDNGNNVENLTLTGHGNINGTGNDKDNEITGNTGNNVLNGGAGKDILDGTEGSDIYLINALSDYTPSVGITDEITDTGLTGADEIRFAATTIGTLTLSANTTGIESVVIGTGTKANAVTTGTIALNVDASAVQNALTITGNTGTNKLTGTDFNDTLDGGKGIDMLTGGAGDDTYTVDNIFDHIAESGGRTGGEDTVITSLNNYELTIIDLENLTLTGSARIGTGNAEANIITGNAGSNTLYGLAGNDTLDGGKGADTLYGGEGSDVYVVDNVGDKVVEDDADPLTGGFDKVLSSISYSLIDTDGKGDNGNNVENLTLTGHGNINGTGNDKDNEITGNTGNNVLNGGAGKDILDGTEGSDIYLINALSDYTPSVGITDEITDTGLTGADEIRFAATTIGTLTLSVNTTGIESVVIGTGTKANAVTTGTTALNVDASAVQNALTITGNTGTNKLTGTDFNDTLDGGKGGDILDGGLGDDTYVVENIADKIKDNGGIDTVKTSLNNYGLFDVDGNSLENLTLIDGAQIGTGNELDNVITGNAVNNVLSGKSGNDLLKGGAGNDILIGGAGDDTLDGEAGNDLYLVAALSDYTLVEKIADTGLIGTDEIRFTVSLPTNSAPLTLTLNSSTTGIESVVIGTGTGATAVTTGISALNVNASALLKGLTITGNNGVNNLIGTQGDDILNGNEGDDALDGGLGNDILNGGVGTDELNGGLGNDFLDGGAGADKLNGGDGDDTYVMDDAGDVITDTGGVDTVRTSTTKYTALGDGLENIILLDGVLDGAGNELNNIITGNTKNNTLKGLAGNDTLDGGVGNDILDGGFGVDTLIGGMGDDTYNIDITADGKLEDAVIENANEGVDIINLSGSYSNQAVVTLTLGATLVNVENLDISETGTSKLNLTGNALNNTLIGNSADNVLNGGAGNDILTGGTGKDKFAFSTALNKLTNIDTITDFIVADDTIQLSKSIFTTLGSAGGLTADYFYSGGAAAHDANDHIIYNKATGILYYDSDGTGTAAQVQIVTLTGLPILTIADFTVV